MVLLGISILVASLSFIVYRNLPRTWRVPHIQLLERWRKRPHVEESKDQRPKASTADQVEKESLHFKKNVSLHPQQSSPPLSPPCKSPAPLSPPVEGPSPETTPKAQPQHQLGQLEIPSLNLNIEDNSIKTAFSATAAEDAVGKTPLTPNRPLETQRPIPPSSINALRKDMLPPPRPSNASTLRAPPSMASRLRVPTAGSLPKRLPASSTPSSSLAPPPSLAQKTPKPREKVLLSPGHSPLDWARLQKSGKDLRGIPVPHLIHVTPSMLRYQNGRKGRDAWSVWQGKVYNITPYLPFHPGGESELMKAAGREGGKLFMEVHPWVNWENMLGECMVGVAVDEDSANASKPSRLDDLD